MLCGSFYDSADAVQKKIYKLHFLMIIGNIHNSLYFQSGNNVL